VWTTYIVWLPQEEKITYPNLLKRETPSKDWKIGWMLNPSKRQEEWQDAKHHPQWTLQVSVLQENAMAWERKVASAGKKM
jgi:hypothetical protein